jgi:hypothetical protein
LDFVHAVFLPEARHLVKSTPGSDASRLLVTGPRPSTLKRLCDLLALTRLEQAKGWYIENGAMSGVKPKALNNAG